MYRDATPTVTTVTRHALQFRLRTNNEPSPRLYARRRHGRPLFGRLPETNRTEKANQEGRKTLIIDKTEWIRWESGVERLANQHHMRQQESARQDTAMQGIAISVNPIAGAAEADTRVGKRSPMELPSDDPGRNKTRGLHQAQQDEERTRQIENMLHISLRHQRRLMGIEHQNERESNLRLRPLSRGGSAWLACSRIRAGYADKKRWVRKSGPPS